ncbi:amino acid permease [Verrucomicrobiota bacterium]
MADKHQISSELSRELSLFHITMMGLGMMIGAGVFIGMGNAILHAGPGGVVLTFALNGVLALFTAMSYAELSSAIPRAGGAYNFARVGFGRETSFLAGWMEWFASSVAGSLYAVTFAIYTVRFLSVTGALDHVIIDVFDLEKIVAVIVAAFFIYINYRGASETGRIGAFFTLGQTLFLVVIGVVGIVTVVKDPSRLQNFQPFMPEGWGKLLITMGFTYVAFEGFEVIAQAGDEAIDPRRNLPKAMLYSVFIVTIIYIVVAFAAVIAVKDVGTEPWKWIGQFKEKGFGEAVSRLMPAGNLLLTLAVIFASTSALNATIYSATRASYALGRDRMLPSFFAKISKTRKTPWVALLFTGLIIIIIATVLPTMDVASSASIMFLFLFFLVNLCVIKIRRNMSDELTYGFIMPFFPLFPIVAIIGQVILAAWLVHMSVIAWIVAPVWILSGALIYRLYSKSRVETSEHEILVFEEEKAPEGSEYKIMVAVANPDNALNMIRHTYTLCAVKDARVEILHMVPVPDQVPLSDAGLYMLEGKEAVTETMLYLAPQFPSSSTIRYCRNVARGIVSAAREKKADMLIIGWRGSSAAFPDSPRASGRGFVLGSTVDPVVERVPCNVVVLKNCQDQKFKHILVPVAGGPNSAFAFEIAGVLAEKNAGKITAFTVGSGERIERFDIEEFVENNMEKISLPRTRINIKISNKSDVVSSILKEIDNEKEEYDLVVMGYTRQSQLRRMRRASAPESVARLCSKPFVMVKASGGIKSWVKRWM